ncbi:MAG: crossover junction endodeoxyribonuclease RuvC [Coriobacteriia bacterium]|nr:crossover junction endodeoxyribonuclease RuvC [Coriobacteriia bacterium]
MTLIVLGIDPGLANTGWGVVRVEGPRCEPLAYGCIKTAASQELPARLTLIHDEVRAVVGRFRPDACAIESIFFGTNAKSAFATGQARGVALLALAGHDITLAEYSPVQIKSVVVGTGTADKRQVTYMVRAALGLDHDPKPDHAADALAAALTHARLHGWGIATAEAVGA